MKKFSDLLNYNQVAIIITHSGKNSLDFSVQIAEDGGDNTDEEELAIEAITCMAAGIIAEVKEKNVEWFNKGRKVMQAAKEINENGKF
jgi:hypothetical protein